MNEPHQLNPRLAAFLVALPHADPNQLVTAPGLGTFRAKHVTSGLERGVLVIHSTGMGLALLQPKAHGICRECADAKGSRSLCEHCQCSMCVWLRTSDERTSPRVSADRWRELMLRLKTFEIGAVPPVEQGASLVD